MPYITNDKRRKLDPIIDQLHHAIGELELDDFDGKNNTQGNLNYVVTRLLHLIYTQPTNYQAINDVNGLLMCIRDEFNQKVTIPYERQKEHDNGEIKI